MKINASFYILACVPFVLILFFGILAQMDYNQFKANQRRAARIKRGDLVQMDNGDEYCVELIEPQNGLFYGSRESGGMRMFKISEVAKVVIAWD